MEDDDLNLDAADLQAVNECLNAEEVAGDEMDVFYDCHPSVDSFDSAICEVFIN